MTAARTIKLSALAVLLLAVTSAAQAQNSYTISDNTYAAVAFSSKTGEYGFAYDYNSRFGAEKAALARCKEPDAKIIGWVKFGWLVVALGDDHSYGIAWEYGDGANSGVASRGAQEKLKEQGGKLKTLLVICSGDIDPKTIEVGK